MTYKILILWENGTGKREDVFLVTSATSVSSDLASRVVFVTEINIALSF